MAILCWAAKNSLRGTVFLLAVHSYLYSFALRISSNSHSLLQLLEYTVKEKGEKPDKNPPSPWLSNP
jgi:hypothetical protein